MTYAFALSKTMRMTVISDSVNTVRGAVIFDPNGAAKLPLVGVLGSLLGIMPKDQLLTDDQLPEASTVQTWSVGGEEPRAGIPY